MICLVGKDVSKQLPSLIPRIVFSKARSRWLLSWIDLSGLRLAAILLASLDSATAVGSHHFRGNKPYEAAAADHGDTAGNSGRGEGAQKVVPCRHFTTLSDRNPIGIACGLEESIECHRVACRTNAGHSRHASAAALGGDLRGLAATDIGKTATAVG